MHRKVFYLGTTLIWSGCTCASEVTIAPPRVPEGGRAVAIAVNQSNQKNLIVATESGGLFRTFDGGASFQHLDAFPTYAPVDVAIASANPNVVMATARDDFRTTSGGGIWRSTDGGASWSRPSGWPPDSSSSCPARPAASGISHMPLSTTFYVATDCGIAVSTDNGATFSMVVLDSTHATVRAVLVVNRSAGVAADDNRLWFIRDASWHPVNGGPAGSTVSIHALASPWWANASIFYFVGSDRQLYFSTDAGASWTQTTSPQQDPNRELFVRVARGLDHDPTHLDLYFGNGTDLYRQAVTVAVPGGSNAWNFLALDHSDPADVAFSPGYETPIMLATDGGVHLTPDNGATWKLTGSGYGGFTALQIGEVTGRFVAASPSHLDLFYGTQDNGFHASLDGGHSWGATLGSEGAFISADAASPAHVASPVALRNCHTGGCSFLLAKPTFDSTSPFPNAPDGNPQNADDPPFQIVGDAYIQDVPATGSPLAFNFSLTTTLGAAWSSSFSLPFQPQGRVQFAGSLANPVIYTGVKRSGSTIGLYSAQNIAGQATVRPADSTGLGSIGLLLTAQARYAVFGVDPADPNHLLAADVGDSTMKASSDGGLSWFALPALTTAVTDTGRFLAAKDVASFATAIAWDPTNSCHILIGTMQNGVIRSADGGRTWRRVAGSAVVPYVSSFFFPPTGSIWMSAYGRGLWTLNVDRRPPKGGRCAFPRPGGPRLPDTLIVVPVGAVQARVFSGLSDTIVCSTCTVLTVRNGRITDVTTDGARVNAVAISSGMVEARDRTGKEVSLAVPNSYASSESERLRRLAGGRLAAGRRVRAVVLRGDQLVALVLARDAIPLPPSRAPLLYVSSAGRSRVPSVALVGDSINVFGYGFLAGVGASGVDVVVGADTVARGIRVGGDGTFSVRLSLSRAPGLLVIAAIQRDGKRLTIERSDIDIVARDGLR